jgi:hypothetical protein
VALSAGLVPGLTILTAALDDPAIDLATSVRQVAAAVVSAVPAYVGLSLHIDLPGEQVVVVAMNGIIVDADIGTSLRIPLFREPIAGDVALVLYGSVRGAFVDLHADLSWVVGRADSGLELDHDLAVPAESLEGLANLASVNQAIGVLIAGGYTPEQAIEALDDLAATGEVPSHAVARRVLEALEEERRSR